MGRFWMVVLMAVVGSMGLMGCGEEPGSNERANGVNQVDGDGDGGEADGDGSGDSDDGDGSGGDGDGDGSDGDGDGDGSDGDGDGSDGDGDGDLECGALGAATGVVVEVSVDDVEELPQMVRTAEEGTTFEFAPGTYEIPGPLHVRAEGVTLRSRDNDAESVVIDGRYEVTTPIFVQAADVVIAHLTVTRALHHPIHISPTSEHEGVMGGHLIYDVRLIDGAQQFVKVNPNGARTAFVDNGRLECSYFELTDAGRPNVDRSATGCYTGGIDAHGARGWVVRNNEFVDIYCAGEGLAEHAVHFWRESRDTLVEKNIIRNCARGVGFGLGESGSSVGGREYADDPYPEAEGYIGHFDGIIRNNLIYADHEWFDTGIELAQARGAKVFHNTIYTVEADGAFSSIDVRFANGQAEVVNNLVARMTTRNGGVVDGRSNLEGIAAELFVDVDGLDFRLRSTAVEAIDVGEELAESGVDLLGNARSLGDGPDLGAYEFVE